jgi:hypothetical protein
MDKVQKLPLAFLLRKRHIMTVKYDANKMRIFCPDEGRMQFGIVYPPRHTTMAESLQRYVGRTTEYAAAGRFALALPVMRWTNITAYGGCES